MAKEKKARYIVELDVLIEPFQFHILEKRFEIARHISNACKRVMMDNLARMKKDSDYQYGLKQPKSEERSSHLVSI
ncbi:hypothetical protein [Bacillus sp. ISL-46]|uniref:hypothetical protein n=1 Tax=Bacillus sp. ISL-46 TaxID=2819129 RepID=UPI001BEBA7B0|nr:hypothetical protein [Bacillus sp. ISL-46]MBT2722609.1 hypothetical protein [Bacillus sp. ISL-46]